MKIERSVAWDCARYVASMVAIFVSGRIPMRLRARDWTGWNELVELAFLPAGRRED